jgi:hypothetical protein
MGKILICKNCKQELTKVGHPITYNRIYVYNEETGTYEYTYDDSYDDDNTDLYCPICGTYIEEDEDIRIEW